MIPCRDCKYSYTESLDSDFCTLKYTSISRKRCVLVCSNYLRDEGGKVERPLLKVVYEEIERLFDEILGE